MPDFDPNVAASIAAENTFQASQERPAAYTSEVIRTGHWPFAWGFVIRKNGEFVYGEKNIESRRAAQKDADDLIYRTLNGLPTTVTL